MKQIILSLISITILLPACTKSVDNNEIQSSFEVSRLVNKDWYWGGKSEPQMYALRFNSDSTGTATQCHWIAPPYQYWYIPFKWAPQSKDSIRLFDYNTVGGPYYFRIFSLNDSVMITNNFLIAGPGISDTTKQILTTF